MGKKVKTGKSRRDKFYRLAKESGYRARSAFKLIQLNRKFEFLQKSRVCIDLCAAPGGWLQVAQQHMPMSSLIIGVDLVGIKPISNNIITLQEDITSDKCRLNLKKELQTWKADVVLHDGAPNVGQNWIHDAFQQAQLTLQALKLATGFLKKGGWFVTKVFRSKDYHALLWVFNQMFKKVHATKPQASRNESAEIFVVCQGYYAPDTLDPKFTDPRHIFKEVDNKSTTSLNLIHPEKQKKNTDGYAEGDYTLFHKLAVSQFLESANHLELLADANELDLDDDRIANHSATNAEIKECCRDIKVLGKKEIRNLLKWRTKMKKYLESLEPKEGEEKEKEEKEEKQAQEGGESDSDEGADSDTAIDNQLADIKAEEMKEAKRKKRKVQKEKSKLRDRLHLDMVIPGDKMDDSAEIEMFNLKRIKNRSQLKEVEEGDHGMEGTDDEDDDDDSDGENNKGPRTVEYDRFDEGSDLEFESDDDDDDDDESSAEEEEDEEDEDPQEEEESNPLVVDLEGKSSKVKHKTDMWFNKGSFAELEEEEDEDIEIEKMTEDYRKRGGVVLEKKKKQLTKEKQVEEEEEDDVDLESDSGHASDTQSPDEEEDDDDSDSDSDSDSDAGSDYDIDELIGGATGGTAQKASKRGGSSAKDGFEIVPAQQPGRFSKLDPVGLALGEEMVKSRKRRREIIEESFNRHTFNDDGLPDWFLNDEMKHRKPQMPVSKELIKDYKDRARSINERPIKKVAEAKARKKRKGMKKLENARKKAEAITDAVDVSEKEKWQQIKQIYKKAGLLKNQKKEVTYVVCKKGVGKRVRRPAGVSGQFKVVDPRMKKDMNAAKKADQKKGKGKGKGRDKGRQRSRK